jgi:hypothetical protein
MSHRLASGSLTLALLVGHAAADLGPAPARANEPQAANAPVLTIEEAIDISKRCVVERDIRVVGSFIESARFERNPRGDRGPFWRITWAQSREIKGGQVFVAVFADRACEVTYGE